MDSKQVSQVTTGLIVIMVGLVFLGGQLNRGVDIGKLWPLVFVVIGLGKFMSTPNWSGVRSGLWFLFMGAIFLLNNFRILGLGDSWPLFIVVGGLSMMFSRRDGRPTDARTQS